MPNSSGEADTEVVKVGTSMYNTSKLPVLKEKEMKELLLKIKNGETECREIFIKSNFSNSVISRFDIFSVRSTKQDSGTFCI